jgi:hypothetical protein
MNKTLKFVAVIAVLALAALACSFSASSANFADAYMAVDSEGTVRTTTYGPGDVFYAIVDLANAPDTTEVRAVWTAVNVEGEAPDTLIDEASITTGDAILTFDLANSAGMIWPNGAYRVDLYLNGELKDSLSFSVQ